MRGTFNRSTFNTIRKVAVLLTNLAVPAAFAHDAMPVAQQNALVQKYCAVCHTDAARSGGLSLEHFNAAYAAPSLAAMMVSKLTSGVPLETAQAAASDPSAAALVATKMKTGAMGAAGIPLPDKATIDALIYALASEAGGAKEWAVDRTDNPAAIPTRRVSILRELDSTREAGVAASYRLVLECNAETHEGEMQLAWAPGPKLGTMSASVDGRTPLTYKVESAEKMGTASQVNGGAAITLYSYKKDPQAPRMALPAQTLTISNLFPNETVEFPFRDLTQSARQSLAPCFTESHSGQ